MTSRSGWTLVTFGLLLGSLTWWGGAAAVPQEGKPATVKPEQIDYSKELPRIPPLEPKAALATLKVQPGFRVEQVAAEPLVASPVAIAWDERGRMFVVEMRGYSEHRNKKLSRVRLLEDADGDGIYEKATVFVDQLLWPTAVACWDGGIFVGDAPDLWYFKDTNGDGVADIKKKVFTGFGVSNVQGLLNTFLWTLDNRIHGSASSNGGELRRTDTPDGKTVSVRGRDFSFNPRTLELRPESGGAQHGMTFDDWGRKFVSSNSDHAQQVMFEDRYVARNPYLAAPGARVSIATDGPQATVYRSSPVEPWRIVRTRLRVEGVVKGVIEGGGRPAGYFTGATGLTVVRGDAFPPAWRGEVAIVGDVGSNLVHRKQLTLQGVQYAATRIDKESELVASTDIWFRPAQFANGPDGCLYVIDVYREVIEHPDSLPPIIKKHLDLDSGRDRGRIYRLVPDGYRPRKLPDFSTLATADLVRHLDHPNAWHRETAARLLCERQDPHAAALLRDLVQARETTPQGCVHGLSALAGLNQLKPELVLFGLGHRSPRVREPAVRLAERVLQKSSEVRQRLLKMTNDADTQVRYQLAFTLGELPAAERAPALAQLLRRDGADRWFQVACLSSLSGAAGEVLLALLGDESFRKQSAVRGLLQVLASQVGAENRRDELRRIVAALNGLNEAEHGLALTLLRGLSEGLARSGRQLADLVGPQEAKGVQQAFQRLVGGAKQAALDPKGKPKARLDAIQTLALASFTEVREVFTQLLDPREGREIHLAALGTLGKFGDRDVTTLVLQAWPGLSPQTRGSAAEILLARPERIDALLTAVEAGKFNPNELEPARIDFLRKHRSDALRARALKAFANLKSARRQDVVDAYQPALTLKGDVARGKTLFGKHCATCHRLENLGHEIGPNLAAMQNRGPEAILLNVLDPSREVNPQYVSYVVATRDGRTLTGMITAETATSLTLKRAENQSDVVLRTDIEALRSTGTSLMPDGLEKELNPQALADVIAYLLSIK